MKVEDKISGGIYGIYYAGKLVYIGMTTNSFEERFKQHQEYYKKNSNRQYLYPYLHTLGSESLIEYKPLIKVEDISKYHRKTQIRKKELQCMEYALITLLKPEGNISGTIQPYDWR